ncbi:hypothetical protein PVAP13_9KG393044 [Panicum virgatum]|uniref:Uncharacterized protein n=1 Tax=Panicum virgatum TaxID=38727 RepID=A0A8T0N622_PANVG|nr:hypothetical protein PVAP13_9KG393044 [Panicum virgatum]
MEEARTEPNKVASGMLVLQSTVPCRQVFANRQSGRPSIQSIPTCKTTGGCSAGAPSRHGAAVLVGWWQAMVLAASATANRYSTPPGHRSGSGHQEAHRTVSPPRTRRRPASRDGVSVLPWPPERAFAERSGSY